MEAHSRKEVQDEEASPGRAGDGSVAVARAEEQEHEEEEEPCSRSRRSIAVIRGGRLLPRKVPLHEAGGLGSSGFYQDGTRS